MSNVEHLIENALSWLENGWNMSEFGKDKVNHELLGYVDASEEEIVVIARYILYTRCAWCEKERVVKCDECASRGEVFLCPLYSSGEFTENSDYCSLAVKKEEDA